MFLNISRLEHLQIKWIVKMLLPTTRKFNHVIWDILPTQLVSAWTIKWITLSILDKVLRLIGLNTYYVTKRQNFYLEEK